MVEVFGTAEFSEDMAETLQNYFQDYAVNGVVSVEVTDRGLWLVNPDGKSRQFLGLARFPSDVAHPRKSGSVKNVRLAKLN